MFKAAFCATRPWLAYAGIANFQTPDQQPRVWLWDLERQHVLLEMPLPGLCTGLALSEDGSQLVTAVSGDDNAETLALWELPGGRRLAVYPAAQGSQRPGSQFAVTRDFRLAARFNASLQVMQVFELASGAKLWTASAPPENQFMEAAFSADGRFLAACRPHNSHGLPVGKPALHRVSSLVRRRWRLEFLEFLDLAQVLEGLFRLGFVHDAQREADMYDHIVADLRLRHVGQAHFLDHPAEADLAGPLQIGAGDAEDFARDCETHVQPFCLRWPAPSRAAATA
jgi:hypothetical protein